MTELLKRLDNVLIDARHQRDCISQENYEEMWDSNDLENWESVTNILEEVSQRMEILEHQNDLMWVEKPYLEPEKKEVPDEGGN